MTGNTHLSRKTVCSSRTLSVILNFLNFGPNSSILLWWTWEFWIKSGSIVLVRLPGILLNKDSPFKDYVSKEILVYDLLTRNPPEVKVQLRGWPVWNVRTSENSPMQTLLPKYFKFSTSMSKKRRPKQSI